MARHDREQSEDALGSELDDGLSEAGGDGAEADDTGTERSAAVEEFWSGLRVDPVEIALPRGVGYTLRAYRMSDTLPEELLAPAPVRDADDFPDTLSTQDEDEDETLDRDLDDEFDEVRAEDRRDRSDDDAPDELDEPEELDDRADDAGDTADDADEDEQAQARGPEEVPLFLTHDNRLLLFRSAEGLVDFVRSGGANDLQAIPEWDALQKDLDADHVVVADEDKYELDLVVENLRGGHDAWEPEILIKAGEVCRDLGHTLRLESVVSALAPGSPLDDLDEALRNTESGRMTAFLARRKLRRVGAQQAALAWRAIIGKISTSVDWRD